MNAEYLCGALPPRNRLADQRDPYDQSTWETSELRVARSGELGLRIRPFRGEVQRDSDDP